MHTYYIQFFVYQKLRQYKTGKKKGQNKSFNFKKDNYLGALLIKEENGVSTKESYIQSFLANERITRDEKILMFTDANIKKSIGPYEKMKIGDVYEMNNNRYGFIKNDFSSDTHAINWFNTVFSSNLYFSEFQREIIC